MNRSKAFAFTALALAAFAGNSLLCRYALKHTRIDAGTFTALRLLSGATALAGLVAARGKLRMPPGSWLSALALSAYAIGFSYAYMRLPTGTGALMLFGSVQISMISYGLIQGERVRLGQALGYLLAFAGLVALVLPGVTAPPVWSSAWMITAGISWGVYSLRGKGAQDPLGITAGNFIRTLPIAAGLFILNSHRAVFDSSGILFAVVSGALTSGIGYALWYAALRGLNATQAATVQLSVPVIAGIGGVLFLHEAVTTRLALASASILGGIALVIFKKDRA